MLRLLRRRGIFTEAADDAPDPLAETSLALAGITSAAVQGRSAVGVSGNAALIAIMADRLRELDPGWPANASAPGSTPDENNDDEEE